MSNKFTINKDDYIEAQEFSREELEKFCELAVKCGFNRGEWLAYMGKYGFIALGIYDGELYWSTGVLTRWKNITTQFRAYLDYKETPKSLLKDGMRCTMRDGTVVFVTGKSMQVDIAVYGEHSYVCLNDYNDDLASFSGNCDIMLITDRDGTVVWQRSEPLRLTLAEIAEHFGVESVEIVT